MQSLTWFRLYRLLWRIIKEVKGGGCHRAFKFSSLFPFNMKISKLFSSFLLVLQVRPTASSFFLSLSRVYLPFHFFHILFLFIFWIHHSLSFWVCVIYFLFFGILLYVYFSYSSFPSYYFLLFYMFLFCYIKFHIFFSLGGPVGPRILGF